MKGGRRERLAPNCAPNCAPSCAELRACALHAKSSSVASRWPPDAAAISAVVPKSVRKPSGALPSSSAARTADTLPFCAASKRSRSTCASAASPAAGRASRGDRAAAGAAGPPGASSGGGGGGPPIVSGADARRGPPRAASRRSASCRSARCRSAALRSPTRSTALAIELFTTCWMISRRARASAASRARRFATRPRRRAWTAIAARICFAEPMSPSSASSSSSVRSGAEQKTGGIEFAQFSRCAQEVLAPEKNVKFQAAHVHAGSPVHTCSNRHNISSSHTL